ncbi:MAG: LacI family DNA-binding transcriptional regulator [Rhodospirillales bacterium]|jgi:LacI family transcriptional regulator
MTARPATLRDVAALAGTTPMTVSNVVNGRAGQVGAEVTRRVMAACETLGYRPHAAARRLRTNRRQAIGMVIVDPSPHYVSDPLTAAVLAGITARLGREGYSTVIDGVAPGDLEAAPLLSRIESDGIFLMTSGTPAERAAAVARVADLGQPILLLQEEVPDGVPDAASIVQDDRGGAEAVARHLFADGRVRHAAMLVPALEWPAMVRREAGVRAVLAQLDRPPTLHVLRTGDEGFAATQGALAAHLPRHGPPDALIGGNDQMAIAGMALLRERGLRVPDDVRVTGFNGLEFWRYASPPLTTVFSPAYAIGETAAEAMLERLATGAFPFRRHVLPVRFSVHGSSDPGGSV